MDVKGEQLMRKLICEGHEREGYVPTKWSLR